MTPALVDPPSGAGWDRAWADALAELEISVDEAEALLRDAHALGTATVVGPVATWIPPSHLGLLPTPLADRARSLLRRQLRVAQQLAETATHSRRQLRAVDGMRSESESDPVYLDAAG
jgi:hypothetical protein